MEREKYIFRELSDFLNFQNIVQLEIKNLVELLTVLNRSVNLSVYPNIKIPTLYFTAACFLELWKRYSAEMTHRWDLTGFDVYEEHPRPQYLARLAHVKRTQVYDSICCLDKHNINITSRL